MALQGLMLPILIGGGIGAVSALARGESTRNVFKSMGLGALFAGIGGALFKGAGLGGGTPAVQAAGGLDAEAAASLTREFGSEAAMNLAQQTAQAPLTTMQSIGIGTTAGALGDSMAMTRPTMEQQLASAAPYSEEDYAMAYSKARDNLSGITERAPLEPALAAPPASQQQALYDFQSPRYQLAQGGIVDAMPKYREGGVNYLPSKTDHDESDATNYVRAMGYVEDGSGNGDKDEDTMLAQLADGEFVSRADAILGAGIMSGANPKDMKDMRSKGAKFFYNQQDQLKRIYDIVNDGSKTS
ncbi:MAG: hypothetical protein CMF74_10090 [Maricaulis sp.]|nr:hypothetical protein [Maricaulis sp.]